MKTTLTNGGINRAERLRKIDLATARLDEYTRLLKETEKELISLGVIDRDDFLTDYPSVWKNLSYTPMNGSKLEHPDLSPEEDPVWRLADLMEYELRNSPQKAYQMQGLRIDTQDNGLRFHISGFVSGDNLEKLFEEFATHALQKKRK